MTHMFKKQSNSMGSPTVLGTGALGMHKDSRVISKVQPKIRIIHIFAPEIIKTDVANFRELVQQLTGKPSSENGAIKGKGKKVKRIPLEATEGGMISYGKPMVSTKLEVMTDPSGSSSSPSSTSDHLHPHQHQHHDDQEVWRGHHSNTSGGYLTAFTDLDDNFDFSTVFHMGATDHGSSHLNAFGETTQLSFRG